MAISKSDMITAINHFFETRGQRMTNLSKSTKDKLEIIIKKYNINIEHELEMIMKIKKAQAEEQAKRDILQKIEAEKKRKLLISRKHYWLGLPNSVREPLIKQFVDVENNENEKSEQRTKAQVKQLAEDCKKDGSIVSTIGESGLVINGINVEFMHMKFRKVASSEYNECFDYYNSDEGIEYFIYWFYKTQNPKPSKKITLPKNYKLILTLP